MVNVLGGNDSTVYKVLSVVSSFLIVFLSFLKLTKVYFGKSYIASHSFIEACVWFRSYIRIGFICKEWYWILLFLFLLGTLLIIGPLVSAIRILKAQNNEERLSVIKFSIVVMDFIIVVFVLVIVFMTLISQIYCLADCDVESVGLTGVTYLTLAVVIVNRTVFLRKYHNSCYENNVRNV